MPASPDPVDLLSALSGPVEEVAPRLVGGRIRHGEVEAEIVEVEAYGGRDDPASHGSRGLTRRNSVMFGPAGRLYCYLSHGLHVCANVSVGSDGDPAAVLLRAVRLTRGHAVARRRRGDRVPERDLTRGPGRLTQALGIELAHDGVDLTTGPIRVTPGDGGARVQAGPRVGVRRAADRPWRFWAVGAPVSDPRRHPRARPEW